MDFVEMVTITYFVCRCCGYREREDDSLGLERIHPRPDGGLCTPDYRNDPTTRWNEPW